MSDLISRQAAIGAINDLPDCPNGFSDTYDKSCIIGVLEQVPSAPSKRNRDEKGGRTMTFSAETTTPLELIWQYGDDYIEHLKKELSRQMAEGVLDILSHEPSIAITQQDLKSFPDFGRNEAHYRSSIKWRPLVKCKDCKHRPRLSYPGVNIIKNAFPDNICPYNNRGEYRDVWETKFPPDDFFCANGEKEDVNEN